MLLFGVKGNRPFLGTMAERGHKEVVKYLFLTALRHFFYRRAVEIDFQYFQAETAFDMRRKQLYKEYADASRQLRHNLEVFRTQKDSYRQAEDVYEVTEDKYKEGVASMTELLQDEMRLRNAQSACMQAHYQCNVAQLTLLKLSGRLDELAQ